MTRPLRIGLLGRSLNSFRGGVDYYVDSLLRHVAAAAHDSGHRVYGLLDDGRLKDQYSQLPLEPTVVPLRHIGKLLWDHVVTPAWCRSRAIDVVLCPRSFRPLSLPCSSVVVIYDLIYFDRPESLPWWDSAYFRNLHRLSLHRSDAVVTFSAFTTSRLKTLVPKLDPGRIYELPPGPPHPAFTPTHPSAPPLAGLVPKPFALALGGWLYKNARRVIEAFARISDEVEHTLVIVDRRTRWEQPRLQPLVEELGLSERVVFLDRISLQELVGLYRRASAFFYTSQHEGIGIPPLEAMACGCPVVASTMTSIPETTAGAALLVDPENVGSLADAMRAVLLDSSIQDRLRSAGLQRASDLSWSEVAHRIVARMTELC